MEWFWFYYGIETSNSLLMKENLDGFYNWGHFKGWTHNVGNINCYFWQFLEVEPVGEAKLVMVVFACWHSRCNKKSSPFTSFLHLFRAVVMLLLSRGTVRSHRRPRLWRCIERPMVWAVRADFHKRAHTDPFKSSRGSPCREGWFWLWRAAGWWHSRWTRDA